MNALYQILYAAMTEFEEYLEEFEEGGRDKPRDKVELAAREDVVEFIEANREKVFSSRQMEVHFERRYFHWITHRVLNDLLGGGHIGGESRVMKGGVPLNVFWHKGNRYTRRAVKDLIDVIEGYSEPNFTAALGNTGELLVSDGFGRFRFVQMGRNTNEFEGRRWEESEHDVDFIFERDGRAYGIEVKNTLPYINDREMKLKIRLCKHLGLTPVFVVRAMPAIWIGEVSRAGGFTLVLGYQLYPLGHKEFAREVREKTGLPVDAPRALYDGTMQRFVTWHEKRAGVEE